MVKTLSRSSGKLVFYKIIFNFFYFNWAKSKISLTKLNNSSELQDANYSNSFLLLSFYVIFASSIICIIAFSGVSFINIKIEEKLKSWVTLNNIKSFY